MKSLKKHFLFIFFFIVLSISILAFNSNNFSIEIESYNNKLTSMKELQIDLLQMRRAEKDFFLRKDVKYINKLLSIHKLKKDHFKRINLNSVLNIYIDTFIQISNKMQIIGLSQKDGLKKKFRNYAHTLEYNFKNDKHIDHLVNILQLRRYEKDFLLRLDEKYLIKHKNILEKLKKLHDTDEYLSSLNNYSFTYIELVKEMKIIGLNEKSGLRAKMRESAHNLENDLAIYVKDTTLSIKNNIADLKYKQTILYIFFLIFISILLIFILKPIYNAFLLFKSFFTNFSNANQRINTQQLKYNELKDVAHTVNSMLSSRERLENNLIASRDEAQHLQKVKEQFLTNMSHELRTPLNAIIGFSGILKSNLPKEKKLIDPILDGSKHLLSIINDILDLSKIQSNNFTLHNDIFEIKNNLDNCLKQFDFSLSAKNINFVIDSNIKNELHLKGDWLRISQVINNLLSNAIKFTNENGDIKLSVQYNKNQLCIFVKDSGIGITEEEKERILRPFEQADSSTTKNYGGTGLGLSICKAIATMMNGSIEIKSEKEIGSTFTFTIPIDEVDNPNETIINKDDSEITLSAHILIVEDNKTNQLLLTMLLEDLGITYEIANDGLEAVNIYEDNKFDLVLMDENMPNMNGIDAMLKIKQEYSKSVPIIAVTANVMKGDEKRLIEAGMDGFIPKPIDNNELIKVLSLFLNQ